MGPSTSGVFERVVRGTAFIFVGNLLGNLFTFLSRVFAANYLVPRSYGHLALGLTSLWLLSLFSQFGLREALSQKLPRSDRPADLFVMALLLIVPFSIGVAAVTIYSSAIISAVIGEAGFGPILVVLALALPFRTVVRLSLAGFRGTTDPEARIFVRNVYEQGTTFMAVGAGILLGVDGVGIAGSWLFSSVTGALLACYVLNKRSNLLNVKSLADVALARIRPVSYRELLGFSLPLLASGVLWTLMRHVDNILLGVFQSGTEIGIYDAAFTLSQMLLVLLTGFGFMFLPLFSELHEAGDDEQMRRLYTLVTKWMALFSLPVFLVLFSFPDLLLRLVYRPAYSEGAMVLAIISLGFFIHIMMGLNIQALTAIGRSRLVFHTSLLALLLNLAANIILIPPYGIAGAAGASFTSYTLVNLYPAARLYYAHRIHPFSASYLLTVLVSLIVFLTGRKIIFGPSPALPLVGLFLIVFGCLYVAAVIILGFDSEDWELVETAGEHLPVDLLGTLKRFR